MSDALKLTLSVVFFDKRSAAKLDERLKQHLNVHRATLLGTTRVRR